SRQDLEALEQGFRLGAPVRLDVADDDVRPVRLERAGGLEHGVGLADSGGGAEEEHEMTAELARFFCLDPRQEGFGIGPVLAHGDPGCLACLRASSRPRMDAAIVKVRASLIPNPWGSSSQKSTEATPPPTPPPARSQSRPPPSGSLSPRSPKRRRDSSAGMKVSGAMSVVGIAAGACPPTAAATGRSVSSRRTIARSPKLFLRSP